MGTKVLVTFNDKFNVFHAGLCEYTDLMQGYIKEIYEMWCDSPKPMYAFFKNLCVIVSGDKDKSEGELWKEYNESKKPDTIGEYQRFELDLNSDDDSFPMSFVIKRRELKGKLKETIEREYEFFFSDMYRLISSTDILRLD